MIPLFFTGHWTPGSSKAKDGEPLEFIRVHGHCWVDPRHVISMKVIKKEKRTEHTWHCKACDVKERTEPCTKRCRELVPAT